ncbi:cyclophane-forming radical SAM/SPASM peptide maturase YhhB [Granulicella mallensis]|uniref:Radical SAM domain protein n=1 Tax=Granulicella mallensis (strain ATCC BAA-1857 / DSM 23137 / MP5ACTX8) TaxID=682795 RepID=G8P0P4_GRAMM|nr:cyclophane-forming radical SAM/SPASM peptide maturase YhhB [Granulicella mallensis]AEU34652.1 Radical SAM domain protein [Granulicella mallensis MP5ACTX8]
MQLDTVLIKVASRCNINCSYCYVYNQGDTSWQRMPKHMSFEIVEDVIRQLATLYRDQDHPFAVVLHGGEPLLLPRNILEALLKGLADCLPATCSRSIQTNGTLIDDDLLELCVRTGTTLSVSIDGPADVHDTFRIAFNGGGTYARAAAGIARLRQHPRADLLFTGTLCVVDPQSDPCRVYEFFKSLAVPSVDFLFKDGNYAKLPLGKRTVESTEYGRWLAAVWDCYVQDPDPPRIRILDDLGRLLLGGASVKEGCGQTMYGIVVIDTDGTVTKNDTLKSMFDGADRFEKIWSVSTDRLSEIADSREFIQYSHLQNPTSPICRACPLLSVCGGGMPLSRWHPETGLHNPSVYCADYKLLIGHIQETLQEFR